MELYLQEIVVKGAMRSRQDPTLFLSLLLAVPFLELLASFVTFFATFMGVVIMGGEPVFLELLASAFLAPGDVTAASEPASANL